jgi:MFS-type transporter involved in bile tolerance (Atg22 family)
MKNIFGINVGSKTGAVAESSGILTNVQAAVQTDVSGIIKYLLFGLFIFGTIGIIFYLLLENKKRREIQRSEEKFWKNMK